MTTTENSRADALTNYPREVEECREALRGEGFVPVLPELQDRHSTVSDPVIPAELHHDTAKLVRRFARALANKLLAAQRKYGYSDNWMRDDWADECRAELMRHIQKGDPRDVAAYCAFLWHHNESTAPAQPAPSPADERAEGATIPEEVIREQESLNHPATQVFFRAGLLACREYMARFVERESPAIAASIRANWWPSLGNDFGAPRKLDWNELTEGEYGEDGFRAKSADEISPTQEALPIALQFLESLKRVATIDMGLERSFATAMAAEAVAIPNSPAYCLRDLYKPADEYFIDGKPCTPEEYISWQAGIIEAVTKAKLPDPKYYGGSAEEGDQHDVKCAYADGWNDCRASILAAPQPAQADARVGLTGEQREAIQRAIDYADMSDRDSDAEALRALLQGANHAE